MNEANLTITLTLKRGRTGETARTIGAAVKRRLKAQFPGYKVVVVLG